MSARRPSSPGSIRRRCLRRPSTAPAFAGCAGGCDYQLDRAAETVDASVAGLFGSHAVFHDGLGCVLLHGSQEPYLLKSDIDALKTPKTPPLLPEIAGPDVVEPSDPALEGRARSCLRGTGRTAVPPNQGGGRGARRQGDRRALCRRHRRRYAAARLLHDQVGGQRADRHPDAAGPGHAVDAGADSGMARRRPIRAARSRSSI